MAEYNGDAQGYPGQPKRDRLYTRWGALKSERSSWLSHWKEISDYLLPRSGRYFVSDRNRGEKRHGLIQDSTGTQALEDLAAGMMAGNTSPTKPWFRLMTADPDLNDFEPVKGFHSLAQPGVRRLWDTRNGFTSLLKWLGVGRWLPKFLRDALALLPEEMREGDLPELSRACAVSLSHPWRRGEGRGEGLRGSAQEAEPLIRPAATFSPPPRKGEGVRRGIRLTFHRLS